MPLTMKGPWSQQEADEYLAASRYPIRLACNGADGFPRVVALWYRYSGGELHCVMHKQAQLLRLLRSRPFVGFDISPNEPPYHGVRGQGTAVMRPLGDDDTLVDMLNNYLGDTESKLAQWLLGRSDEEVLVSITPTRLFSWDYRERMEDIDAN